jgi:hypothetical protein
MIWSRTRIGFLAAAVLLGPPALKAADSNPPAVIASLELKDGRVLHNVKVMSDEGASIVVRADEGLLKISKANLPAAYVDTSVAKPQPAAPAGPLQYVMQRFDPSQPPEALPPEPGAKPKVNPAGKATPGAPGKATENAVYKGCTIINFQIKSFQNVQGCAEVIIRNDTDEKVMIRPGEITCTTADGARHLARNIITDSFPPNVKRREFVPARGELDDIFAFANEPLEISSVQWTR